MNPPASGPRWLGIGAQRCGTTWFTELLLQHPEVSLSEAEKKELHFFDRFLTDPLTVADRDHYLALFQGPCAGEFTPGYLRWPWVPDLMREVCGSEVVLFVVLRDPVERFLSLVRYAQYRRSKQGRARSPTSPVIVNNGTSAIWGGMYAQHLRIWLEHFPSTQFVVEQYERMQRDPQTVIERAWARLGLDADVVLRAVGKPSASTVRSEIDRELRPQLRRTLTRAYERDAKQVADKWGIDLSLWPNFEHLAG